jgi:hypothetical protein
VLKGNTLEGDYGSQVAQENAAAKIRFGSAIVLVFHCCLHGLRSRTMSRRITDSRVLDSVCENRGSVGYGSEISFLVESELSLDLEGLFS